MKYPGQMEQHMTALGVGSAVFAGMANGVLMLGTYGYLRDKKKMGSWGAGAVAGAIAAAVGVTLYFVTKSITEKIVMEDVPGAKQAFGGLVVDNLGMMTAQRLSGLPQIGMLTAQELSGIYSVPAY